MKNIALVIAGGSGQRMGQPVPKQFLSVNEKPVIIYTLENFEHCPLIDAIAVVCIEGWQHVLQAYAKQFNITKLKHIVEGGASGQHSIFNGVKLLKEQYKDDACVVIHDGIRPLVDESVIESVISTCEKYGNGVTSMPYNEQIFVINDEISTDRYIPRETLRRVATPQAYKLGELYSAYCEAIEKNIGFTGSSYTNTMMADLGKRLYFAKGSDKNIKLTTPGDFEIFKAYISRKEND